MANTHIYDLGNELLNAVNTQFAAAGVELPDRQYVHHGEVAWDCEQLVAAVVGFGVPHERLGATSGFTEVVFPGVPFTNAVDITISLIRTVCGIPDDSEVLPSPDVLDGDAQKLLTDGWLLFNGLNQAASAGSLLGGGCQNVAIGTCLPQGPEGGFAGWVCTVSITL